VEGRSDDHDNKKNKKKNKSTTRAFIVHHTRL